MVLIGNSSAKFDTASKLLSAELALDYVAAAQASQKSKTRKDAPRSDDDIALELQVTSLNALIGVFQDYQFSLSIDWAIASDAPQLRTFCPVDQAERDDHLVVVPLRDGDDLPQQRASQRMLEQTAAQNRRQHASSTTEAVWRAIESRMQYVHVNAVPSVTKPTKAVEKGQCVICRDDVERCSFKALCGHWYCRGCIENLVESSLCDETLHPLRCCNQPLALMSGIFKYISTPLQHQFVAKLREFSVPARSRMYCSNPRCSAFLGASRDQKNITCSTCGTISCSLCKDSAHPDKGCTEHRLTDKLQEIAIANEWQTCPGCYAIVEPGHGCHRMTCRCSAQFCYLCGARWKTSKCRRWGEKWLLDHAEWRVRNELGDRTAEAQPAPHAERVHLCMEMLRENHERRAHSWRYRYGAGKCEECGYLLSTYLMRCIYCQAIVCRRCSVNRL